MNEALGHHIAMNKKRLLLKREYEELSYPGLGNTWREKWSSPLSWVAKMANDQKLKNLDALKILDVKDAIGKSLNAYCDKLQQLNSFNQFRIPAPLLTLLTIAIYAFLILSVMSGQDMFPESYPSQSHAKMIFFDFPWFATTKYLLIFGWLKVATDLMVPFGNRKEHVDLIGFLDFEIWKASHMLAQGIPLQRQIQADPNWRDSDRPLSWN